MTGRDNLLNWDRPGCPITAKAVGDMSMNRRVSTPMATPNQHENNAGSTDRGSFRRTPPLVGGPNGIARTRQPGWVLGYAFRERVYILCQFCNLDYRQSGYSTRQLIKFRDEGGPLIISRRMKNGADDRFESAPRADGHSVAALERVRRQS